LIATKKNNQYFAEEPYGQIPFDEGYLYLDEYNQKLYYSETTWDRAEYLCDWNKSIADGLTCENYQCTITKQGDLIFMRNPVKSKARCNPIIYPHTDYNNPKVIDFGGDIKPFGVSDCTGRDVSFNDDFFMFGDYRTWDENDNDTELYIWKVTSPYDTKECWKRVHTMYFRHYNSGKGSRPDKEIGHFHTCQFDHYSGAWLASTGDIGWQCRILMSKDNGVTWVDQNLGGGQYVRLCGFVFTKDAVWYQTDSTLSDHALYRALRDANGYPDFTTLEKVCQLSSNTEAGYSTALLRDPYGLLFIDRVEAMSENEVPETMEMSFYSFEDNTLYCVGKFAPFENFAKYDTPLRYGMPQTTFTGYQSPCVDGIVMGTTSNFKAFTLDVLNNNEHKVLGNVKISLKRK
jgi:hypothetical protein